jgi:lipopolysaccharide biosynthesis protein
MKRLCIYATTGKETEQVRGRYVPYALKKYKEIAERVIVVTDIRADHPNFNEIDAVADLIVRSPNELIRGSLDGYRLGFAAVGGEELASYDEIIFVDTVCYGPVYPLQPILDDPRRVSVDFWSAGFFTRKANRRIFEKIKLDQVMTLNFFTVNRRVAMSPVFQEFMREDHVFRDDVDYRVGGEYGLHLALERAGFKWGSFLSPDQIQTDEPLLYEAAELVRLGCPIVLRNIFSLDPLLADMQAVECRRVLAALAENTDFDTAMIWESVLPYYPLRLIQSNMDDLRIFDSEPAENPKRQWDLGGKIAVVAHIYYVEMLPEFLELVAKVPCDFDFFISTSSPQHKQKIEEGLKSFDCGGSKVVRVVEQNRGRDMSSLFITFRDVMLSGEYAWALRLHSKRTPQMSWQIGQSFKRHLIENLVPSRRFVQCLFDLLEKPEYRNVGIVAPPVVHIGFGTLGHSWFANRKPVERLAKKLGIDVPLDSDTPVAVYGTMYWFRPEALAPMFRYDWKWEDYNAEPHHIDGGLAHVQERLICYCAQDQGFRTLALMSSAQAARSYLKLEYKHQLLSSCFPVRDIRLQYQLASGADWKRASGFYTRFLNFLERADQQFHLLAPKLWELTRPLVDVVWPMMKGLQNAGAKRSEDASKLL